MYLGKMCEIAPSDDLYRRPAHPYTKGLVDSIPKKDPHRYLDAPRTSMKGEPASPVNPPSGCRFHTRCDYADEVCGTTEPTLQAMGPGHFVACHYPLVTPVSIEERSASTALS